MIEVGTGRMNVYLRSRSGHCVKSAKTGNVIVPRVDDGRHGTCVPVIGKFVNKKSLLICNGSSVDEMAGGAPTAWDPEGLLQDAVPKEGHFARREREAKERAAPGGDSSDETGGSSMTEFGQVPSAPDDGFGAQVDSAFQEVFSGANVAPRVLDSFRRLCAGLEHVQHWPGKGHQQAGSFMEGLEAQPFPDLRSGKYAWLEKVEENAGVVMDEFANVMKDPDSLLIKGNRVWAKAALDEAVAYGPNWRTLVLQDRGTWDECNSRVFPKTKKLLEDIDAPTLEVFFARQDGRTGIKPHTDNANFIQTTHLGIDIPEGEAWIKVGDFKREWENGKVIICDTSFIHETKNNTDNPRYVLIMRHWHPDVTPIERIANMFLFDALDQGDSAGLMSAQKRAEKKILEMRKGLSPQKQKKSTGFGAKAASSSSSSSKRKKPAGGRNRKQ